MTLEHDSKSEENCKPEICQGRALKQHMPLITYCSSIAQVADPIGLRQVEMAALLNWEVMRPHAKPENPVQFGISHW